MQRRQLSDFAKPNLFETGVVSAGWRRGWGGLAERIIDRLERGCQGRAFLDDGAEGVWRGCAAGGGGGGSVWRLRNAELQKPATRVNRHLKKRSRSYQALLVPKLRPPEQQTGRLFKVRKLAPSRREEEPLQPRPMPGKFLRRTPSNSHVAGQHRPSAFGPQR